MAKCALRPLSELCADFKRQRGSDGSDSKDTALPDDLWEVPSDVPSENEWDEGHMYNPRAAEAEPSRRTALSTLDKLRDKFKERQKERERTSHINVPVGGGSQPKPPAASHTGTLTKLVERKGFGFIVPDVEGTGDVFLHCSELLGAVCGDMFVGMRVRYDVEVDSRSGKMRARTATILEAESSNAQAVEKRTVAAPEDRGSQDAAKKGKDAVQKRRASGSFTRGELLGAFRRLGRPYGKASKLGILSVRLPKVQGQRRWGYSDSGSDSGTSDDDSSWMEEDACLDDEDLIATMEARLSRESGFDVMNKETFGESYISGWSFEEAVAANAKLSSCHLLSGVVELSMTAKDLEELGGEPTTAGGSADGAETSPMESPGGRSRADSPSEPEAIPQYILEGLQLQ
jgi:cold shock CspA family protein